MSDIWQGSLGGSPLRRSSTTQKARTTARELSIGRWCTNKSPKRNHFWECSQSWGVGCVCSGIARRSFETSWTITKLRHVLIAKWFAHFWHSMDASFINQGLRWERRNGEGAQPQWRLEGPGGHSDCGEALESNPWEKVAMRANNTQWNPGDFETCLPTRAGSGRAASVWFRRDPFPATVPNGKLQVFGRFWRFWKHSGLGFYGFRRVLECSKQFWKLERLWRVEAVFGRFRKAPQCSTCIEVMPQHKRWPMMPPRCWDNLSLANGTNPNGVSHCLGKGQSSLSMYMELDRRNFLSVLDSSFEKGDIDPWHPRCPKRT